MLNVDQKRIFDKIKSHFMSQKEREDLANLHMRLEDIIGTDEWCGSKNILFVGDLLQLPPVNGRQAN